MLTLENK